MTNEELWRRYQVAEKRLQRCRDAATYDPTATRIAEYDVARTFAEWVSASNAEPPHGPDFAYCRSCTDRLIIEAFGHE